MRRQLVHIKIVIVIGIVLLMAALFRFYGIPWDAVWPLHPDETQALQLSADERLLYEKAAVWSSSEVSEKSWGSRFPVLAWFIMLEVIGLLALPLTWVTFKNLCDRGYIFSKALGLLMISWGTWMIASARLAAFTWWTILAVMALLALVSSLLISSEKWNELRTFVREHWRLLLFEEVLFWMFFALLLFIRLRNPDLWHPWLGGEKPMDLAYLTAIVKTPYFPSYDPWFAGGYINYYYFGFVLVSTLIHLTGLMPYVAYNLAVPTFFAMTATGGFAVALNFAESWRNKQHEESMQGPGRWALVAGICGTLFVAVMGNLGQVQLLWDGVRNLSGISAGNDPSVGVILAQFAEGLRQLLDGNKLQFRTEWWYWNATRIIPAAAGEAGPINEMPFFTFLYGDLHAHMMGLPYTLLVLGLALNILRTLKNANTSANSPVWWRDPTEMLTLGFLALTTGALWPINTWDFPTYTVLTAAALACREFARRGRMDVPSIWSVMWRFALIIIFGRLLFLPFHQNYAGDYFGAGLWEGSSTPLWAYLLIHGFFLFVLSSYLIHEFLNGCGHNALVRSLRLNLKHWRESERLQRLFDRMVVPETAFRWGINIGRSMFILAMLILLIRPVVGLPLMLILCTSLLLFSARPNPSRQFLLCMIGLGLVFTIMVEIIVLNGDISRMNTVFKFYLQVWVLWAVASSAVLPELAAHMKLGPRPVRASIPEPQEGTARTLEVEANFESLRPRNVGYWAWSWWWAFGILVAACLLYPLTAAPVRMRDRFENSTSTTLDGSAYMYTSVYNDQGEVIELDWDRQAIDWLRANVNGIPTIVEANTPLYRWGARVSIYSGLPTVIGWDWHQKQQRSVLPGSMIDQRIQDVRNIYTNSDLKETMRLLNQYRVQYIYVGPLERIYYGGSGLAKFDQAPELWDLVYQNEQVKIYKVH
jgi:YYY domain-containing protein